MSGKLFVLTGLSGSGKDTVMRGVLEHPKVKLKKLVTHTTRKPRKNEIPGWDYHFTNEDTFFELIDRGEIIEHVKYGSSYKGTHRLSFENILRGDNYIWRIDPSRAINIHQFLNDTLNEKGEIISSNTYTMCVSVRDFDIVRKRYIKREINADLAEFNIRLEQDKKLWQKHKDSFDHVIYNDTSIDSAVKSAVEFIKSKL